MSHGHLISTDILRLQDGRFSFCLYNTTMGGAGHRVAYGYCPIWVFLSGQISSFFPRVSFYPSSSCWLEVLILDAASDCGYGGVYDVYEVNEAFFLVLTIFKTTKVSLCMHWGVKCFCVVLMWKTKLQVATSLIHKW